MYHRTATRLLSLPILPPSKTIVPATGTRRRVEALATIGWSREEIAARAGVTATTLRPNHLRVGVYAQTAEDVAALYKTARHQPREGRRAASVVRWARSLGYVPSWAWDPSKIDNPHAKPDLDMIEDPAWKAAILARTVV